MSNVESSMNAVDAVSVPCETEARPIESIELTMRCLDEATRQIRLVVTEILSVSLFCAEVKRSLSALVGPTLHETSATAEPILDQLYQNAHHNLIAMKRAGRQTLATMIAVENAASTLCQLETQLGAQNLQATVSAGHEAASFTG